MPADRVKVKSEVLDSFSGISGGSCGLGGCTSRWCRPWRMPWGYVQSPSGGSANNEILFVKGPHDAANAEFGQSHPPQPLRPPQQQSLISPGSPPGKRMKRRRRSGEGEGGESDGSSSPHRQVTPRMQRMRSGSQPGVEGEAAPRRMTDSAVLLEACPDVPPAKIVPRTAFIRQPIQAVFTASR